MSFPPPPSRAFMPALPAFREVPRAVPLDPSDDAVLEAWILEPTGRTLQDFCRAEWTNRPLVPAPPPPTLERNPRMPPIELPPPLPPENIELSEKGLRRAALEAARDVREFPEDPAERDRFVAAIEATLRDPGRPLVLEPVFVRGQLADLTALDEAIERLERLTVDLPLPPAPLAPQGRVVAAWRRAWGAIAAESARRLGALWRALLAALDFRGDAASWR